MPNKSYVAKLVEAYLSKNHQKQNAALRGLHTLETILTLSPSLSDYMKKREQDPASILIDADLELSRRGIIELSNTEEMYIVSGEGIGPITESYHSFTENYKNSR